ncbi:MAG: RNA polymerase sigma factor [Brevinematia bacterium]
MNIKSLTDEQIIYKLQEIRKSDVEAFKFYFDEVFNRYKNQIFNLCRYHGLQNDDAFDVIQETFIKLIKFLPSFEKESAFKPWFFKIVLNLVRGKYNEIKKHRFIHIEEIDSTNQIFEEKDFEKLQNKEYIISILNRIPKKFRDVILLNIYGELELTEIAKILGISLRQVYNRLEKGYQMLKEIFGEDGVEL